MTFQSTHPHGVRLQVFKLPPISQGVSIHAPTRGATYKSTRKTFSDVVSIHAPTRGATLLDLTKYKKIKVSIHAPTRGATASSGGNLDNYTVSIHAPTRGATSLTVKLNALMRFQSTHPHGVRRYAFNALRH